MIIPPERLTDRISTLTGLVAANNRFLVATHINPDGDAIGSILGMGQGLLALGKKVTMFCQGGMPEMYAFLPGAPEVADRPLSPGDYDVIALLDCHSLERAGLDISMNRGPILAVVDHHLAEIDLPEHTLLDTGVSAAGELVYYILQALGVELTPAMATNLFTAISTDTGSFSYGNTTPESLEVSADLVRAGADPWDIFSRLSLGQSPGRMKLLGLALKDLEFFQSNRICAMTVTKDMMRATGTAPIDTDGFVEYPRSIAGVELAVLLKETANGAVKVSLRSPGIFNAAALAQTFNGGGHIQAAGFTVPGSIDQVKEKVVSAAVGLMPASEENGRP